MSVLKRLFSRNRNYKRLKRETEARRLVSILERQAIDCFIDVGANTGQTAERLRAFGWRGRIVSVEPIKSCHDVLLAKSSADPDWIVAPRCALGEREGEVELLVSEGSSLSSISAPTQAMEQALPKVKAQARERVPLHRLDLLLKDELDGSDRGFLKIDAQGHDMEVLRGAKGVMRAIAGIKIEMSLLPLYEGETLYLDILNFLHEAGFQPHLLVDVGYSRKLARQLQIDGVFIRSA